MADDEFSSIPVFGRFFDAFVSSRKQILEKYAALKNPKYKIFACLYCWFGVFSRLEVKRYVFWWYASVFLVFATIHVITLFVFLFNTFYASVKKPAAATEKKEE